MIEVIKHGTRQEIKCKHCGCLFAYEEEDIKYEFTEGVVRISGTFVPCPDCKEPVYITRGK